MMGFETEEQHYIPQSDITVDGVTEEIKENTIATEKNTEVTAMATEVTTNAARIELSRSVLVGLALVATVVISFINPKFAENQAGLILTGVVGGVFGAATQAVRR